MTREYISDQMIDRGVDLWCQKLLKPHFDNGDSSPDEPMGNLLANNVIQSDLTKQIHYPDKIEVFRVTLTELLKQERDEHDYIQSLYVDYGPSGNLGKAGEVAEIPPSLFGCKSSVNINHDYCSHSWGYGQPTKHHYPLASDNWLVTTLVGSDIGLVIDSIHKGNPLNLTVETPYEN